MLLKYEHNISCSGNAHLSCVLAEISRAKQSRGERKHHHRKTFRGTIVCVYVMLILYTRTHKTKAL